MTTAGTSPQHPDPALTLGNDHEVPITSEQELRELLRGLHTLASGSTATLARGPKDYVAATRHGDFWSVVTRRGGYRTLASFTAEMTTEYSERQVREDRYAASIWQRINNRITAPQPERALSADQVETLFTEYFSGRRFSIPQSGA